MEVISNDSFTFVRIALNSHYSSFCVSHKRRGGPFIGQRFKRIEACAPSSRPLRNQRGEGWPRYWQTISATTMLLHRTSAHFRRQGSVLQSGSMSTLSLLRTTYLSLPRQLTWVPSQLVLAVRSFRAQPLKRQLFGEKAYMVPPLFLMEDGPRDYNKFKKNGIDAFQRFLALGLKPTDRILDVGSGLGRKTLPLLDYITTGSYEGIDPIEKQVKWCQEKITRRYPNFRFQSIDVWSKHYNPSGKVRPSEYSFPFEAAQFDFVILGSVFTHMFPDDVGHYIGEISRVLKTGGKGWITFFLLNKDSESAIAEKRSIENFDYEVGQGARADNPYRLETAISHQEELVLQMFSKHNIQAEVIEHGSWSGRQASFYQDICKITKL